MQHSAYTSADKSLKVLPRSGSPLQEIHPEPGHQFCPIWLRTSPWQLDVVVLAPAFENFSMTCTFMLVLSQKETTTCSCTHMRNCTNGWRYAPGERKFPEQWIALLSRSLKCISFNYSSSLPLWCTYTSCTKGCGVHPHHLRGCSVNQTDEQIIEKY